MSPERRLGGNGSIDKITRGKHVRIKTYGHWNASYESRYDIILAGKQDFNDDFDVLAQTFCITL